MRTDGSASRKWQRVRCWSASCLPCRKSTASGGARCQSRRIPSSKAEKDEVPSATSLLLEDYFDLYIAKKLQGYTDDFGEEEVPDELAGER